jgi:hypothetical protein
MSHHQVSQSFKRGIFETKKFGLARMCCNIKGCHINKGVILTRLDCSRALHRVPIPMPMGFGCAWVRYYCPWVGMGELNIASESGYHC